MSDQEINVGDQVRLLPGGSIGTLCEPPLVEGELYIVKTVHRSGIGSNALLYRLQGLGSSVLRTDIELVERRLDS